LYTEPEGYGPGNPWGGGGSSFGYTDGPCGYGPGMGDGIGSPMGVDLGTTGNVELLLVFSMLFKFDLFGILLLYTYI
jgi:hypothetical protein